MECPGTLQLHPYTATWSQGLVQLIQLVPDQTMGLYRAHFPLFNLTGPTAAHNERAHPQQGQVSQDNKENEIHRDLPFVPLLLIFEASAVTEGTL